VLEIQLGFPAAYSVAEVPELPAAGGVREFAPTARIVDGGVLFEVVATHGVWTGLAANAAERIAIALSGIYSTPSPTTVCVVARGDAYLIDVEQPEHWSVLEDAPVVAVRSAVDDGLLVLATPRRILALGPGGIAWKTPRLAIDGVEIGTPVDGHLRGIADPRDEAVEFVVNLRTGQHRGGYSFSASEL
jgi:hypothetical protein